MSKKRNLSLLALVLLAIAVSILTLLFTPTPSVDRISDYALTRKLPANRPDYYPLEQNLDRDLYRPVGNWVGRLVLPETQEYQLRSLDNGDWAWLEIYEAPSDYQNLVGQKVRLGWQNSPLLDRYLQLITKDINFSAAAKKSERQGNVLPARLNGRSQVGPLQALAGARSEDDVLVSFQGAEVSRGGEDTALLIDRMPLMVTGRYVALVKILTPAPALLPSDIPATCPGTPPCESELFKVRHYNPLTSQFDGIEEVVRIPQQPRVSGDRFISTPHSLPDSSVGKSGWYIYGAKGKDGLFTVQALKPRSLFQLQPSEKVSGNVAGSDYINRGNWQDTPKRRGTAQKVQVLPEADSPSEGLPKEGDRGLGIHLFGGIGGKKGESIVGGTVTGHLSYLFYEVVRDRFTSELQWEIVYYQVYAHNPQGILSGSQSWENYTGNLQRGWLNSRPISNVMVKLDVLEDYNFGGVTLSPLTEFQRQLEIMMARYRTGDGSGYSSVTPAASCVQDSNQALYITIETIKERINGDPNIARWFADHPDDPQTERFQRLLKLGERIYEVLIPRGTIRPDWRHNAETLAGIKQRDYPFMGENTLANVLLSWQSMLPRNAHDVMSTVFFEHGAALWFLRTNQVGGFMPEILPLAPTNIFGEVPLISPALRRILASIVFLPDWREWGLTLLSLFIYGSIAIPIGVRLGFLRWCPLSLKPIEFLKTVAFLFFSPALWEELIFRVLLLPYPDRFNSAFNFSVWGVFSLILFVVYHPLNARTFYKTGNLTFFKPIFLILTALLGLTCTIVYWLTGSLWTISFIHWIVVTVWLLYLNGFAQLRQVNLK